MNSEDIEIESAYGDYAPQADYVKWVRGMLAFVPPACLDGIERIALRAGSRGTGLTGVPGDVRAGVNTFAASRSDSIIRVRQVGHRI